MPASSALPNYLLFDKNNTFICPIAEHSEAKVQWTFDKTGTGTITIPGNPTSDIFTAALNLHTSPTLIEVQGVAGKRWTGQLANAEYTDDGDGPELELTLVNDRVWLDAMLAIINPTGTMAQQGTAENDTRTGPTETVIKRYLQDAVNRLGVPMVIAPAPASDPSPIITLNARMTQTSELIDKSLTAANLGVEVTMHRTGRALPASLQGFEPPDGTLVLDFIRTRSNPRLLWDAQQLSSYKLSSSMGMGYRAITGGEGTGTARVFTEYVDTTVRDRVGKYGLPEIYVDNEGTEGGEANYTAAGSASPSTLDALAAAAGKFGVTFSVADGVPWFAGTDWWVADYANARIAGQVFSALITAVELSESDDGVEYTPTIGEAQPGRPEAVADVLARVIADIRKRQARR
jgi:hypothetical protein